MKTRTIFCALSLLVALVATEATAEVQAYRPHVTTVQQMANDAEVIVVGQLDRVDDIALSEPGRDAAVHKRINDGKVQDGQEYILREGVISVTSVLKQGANPVGSELRFVSIRQLKFGAYDADLRGGECVYFLTARPADNRFVVLTDERGTISAAEAAGSLNNAIDLISAQLADGIYTPAGVERTLNAVRLDGSRLSVDSAIELSWHHDQYAPAITAEHRARILDLCKLSAPGSAERNELITAAGRLPAEGAMDGLFEVMLTDPSWSTTSLASMSLEYVNRGDAIVRLLAEYEQATDNVTRTVIVRSLGLIRPKADHDGAELRSQTLELVRGLLKANTDKSLLREALIASRDLRSGSAHVEELKALIGNRFTNGLTDAEVKGAIVALAAARTVDQAGKTVVLEESYLKALAESNPVLKQHVDSALLSPFTNLIAGADGKGH